ncbi:hypothetical protein CPT_Mydo_194 [Proteus phage Mydo]|uniref:Uncharacterized protein n=2 Tax=Caudoviricetes TaxID=2731619 RepID=A0A3G8F163_9CAUD|nr:hypothetical protein HWB97_gp259 [Proteus phage Mydo]AZF87766.1 hypothetical protein CPT_Mydo_194 [Proteus phage Mydo]
MFPSVRTMMRFDRNCRIANSKDFNIQHSKIIVQSLMFKLETSKP